MIQKRAIFPTIMFTAAAASFIFGGWQYFQARSVQAAAQKRLAFIITSIETSGATRMQKQQLYATIAEGLPPSPGLFGLDLSGSFAGPPGGDRCSSDGQRSICRALIREDSDPGVIQSVCGSCSPEP